MRSTWCLTRPKPAEAEKERRSAKQDPRVPHAVHQVLRLHERTPKGNASFKRIHLEDIFKQLKNIIHEKADKTWLKAMEEKYLIK